MAGKKLFTNRSNVTIAVTLVIRAREDPRNQAGTQDFTLGPAESQGQTYGNNMDIYLNGVKLAAIENGDVTCKQQIVIVRGSPLDNELNTRNAVDFTFNNNSFGMSTREVPSSR